MLLKKFLDRLQTDSVEMPGEVKKRVTVLGAGYSGLTTAAELSIRGWTVDIKVNKLYLLKKIKERCAQQQHPAC